MKILVTAATGAEIALSIKGIAPLAKEIKPTVFALNGHEVSFAVTGVGMVATAYHLAKTLAKTEYSLVIQAGIAGCFDRNIPIGRVLLVHADRFADMGAEDADAFIDIFDLGLALPDERPFTGKRLVNPRSAYDMKMDLDEVEALTVNTVTGSDASAGRLYERYSCTLESMEGAAFHYLCLQEDVPFAQVRAVSNYIEQRNRAAWQVNEAMANLNEWLLAYLTGITKL